MSMVKTEVDEFIIVNPKAELEFDNNDENSNEVPAEFVDFPDTVEVTARTDCISDDLEEGHLVIDQPDFPQPDNEKVVLDKLPRPVHALNCRQARTYLVKLLRTSNGGLNPQYGNPSSKPPFWPDYYWPWEKLTDVHTKPRGMEEPLLYSEMMKIAIERGYKFYGFDPETYWDKHVEESEPMPVVRGTPAPIQLQQVKRLGLPPKLPRPLALLNCVQARTVLSKLLRYQQAGNNPVYGHPDTQPPWWPDECIRWIDMVDLRGKPPYLPKKMSYTDVLKKAIDNGLRHFGYETDEWVDGQAYNKEIVNSLATRQNKPNIQTMKFDVLPKLPIPITKMNCSVARTSLARLLRYHCGTNPKYGDVASMPVWWPNESFEWAKLKNLSHRFEGFMGDSYSNCLRLALACGYEHYGKDPITFVEDPGEDLPCVAGNRRPSFNSLVTTIPIINNPDEELVKKFDGLIDSNIDSYRYNQVVAQQTPQNICTPENIQVSGPSPKKRKRPPPPLIPIHAVKNYAQVGGSTASSTFLNELEALEAKLDEEILAKQRISKDSS